ncbi:MAG: 2,3-bisphosphoglycerate-independent phosphoglycerate mutase [Halanaerobiales bacterium]
MNRPQPLALIILDGYGESEQVEKNAVKNADTPYLDKLREENPTSILQASGQDVGLPKGQMGNSEVGHLNLGAGRIVPQEYTRISKAVEDGSILENDVIKKAIQRVKDNGSALHLMGLLSDGGVHSHIKHLFGLLEMSKTAEIKEVYIHAILDGRDTPPRSALTYIEQLEEKMDEIGIGKIATVSGRYYAMDRDHRWDRTKKAYDAYVLGEGIQVLSASEAVQKSYERGDNDEFVLPSVVMEEGKPVTTVQSEDAMIFFNFRADRARQITRALGLDEFNKFDRPTEHPDDLYFICMTEYDDEYDLAVAFPKLHIENTLGEVLSENGFKQLRIAETEKYAHVTFFFNGGEEKEFKGEDRELIPSPKIATYDLQPEMSAFKVKDRLMEKLEADLYDLIILNFANPDMVGHTGFYDAAVEALEAIDQCMSKIVPKILEMGGQALITADHGNSEQMIDQKGEPHTAHTTNPVILMYVGTEKELKLKNGRLADIAPTILDILDIDKPKEMTGDSLIEK